MQGVLVLPWMAWVSQLVSISEARLFGFRVQGFGFLGFLGHPKARSSPKPKSG